MQIDFIAVKVSITKATLKGPKPSYLKFEKLWFILCPDLLIALLMLSFGILDCLAA